MKNLQKILLLCMMILFVSSGLMAQITGDQDVCIDETETYYSSLSGTLTWTITPVSPATFPSGNSLFLTWNVPPGTYTLIADNGAASENLTVQVYATPAPVIDYLENDCNTHEGIEGAGAGVTACDTFCINELVEYAVPDDPLNTYLWTISGGTIVGPDNQSTVYVIWDVAMTGGDFPCGRLTVTETNPAGCSGTDEVFGVSSYPNGTITVSPGISTICLNQSVAFSLSVTGGPFITYSWDFGDGTIVVNSGASPETHTYITSGTYQVVVTASTECCSTSDTVEVIVDNTEGPNIFCISAVCANTVGAEYCTDAVCSTYDWDVDGGVITSAPNQPCITVDWGAGPVGTISLLVGGCSPGLCADTVFATVPIMPDGTFDITGPVVVCQGVTEPYSAPYVPGASYTWTLIPPSGIPVTLPYGMPPYIQDITFSAAGTYQLICSMEHDLLDCVGADTLIIQTAPLLTLSGPASACDGSTVFFSSNYPADWEYNLPITPFGTATTSASTTFPGPGVYHIIASSASVCNSPDSISIVINPLPATPVISGPSVVCPGGTYTYTVSGYSPTASIVWTFTDVSGSIFGYDNSFDLTLPVAFTTGTLSVMVTENGCSNSASITLDAPGTPAPVITTSAANVCPDQTVTYSATLSYPGLSDVEWTISPPSAGTITPGLLPGTVDILWHGNASNTTQTVTLTVTETTCLTSTGTDVITFDIYPRPVIVATGGAFCPGTSFTLTATGGNSYQWFDENSVPVSATVTQQGSYYVVGTDGNGCTNIDYTDVIEYPEPEAFISTPDNVICNDDGTAMTNSIDLYALDNGYTFLWSTGGTTNPITISNLGTYSVTVTDMNGCTNTDTYDVFCPVPVEDTCDTAITPLCACDLFPPTFVQSSPDCNEFTFSSNSTCVGGVFNWTFGDGFSGTGTSVVHSYNQAGYYHVYYSYYDPTCCPPLPEDTVVAVPVAADFAWEVVCNTLTVVDNASFLPPYSIVTWEWDWGDGSPLTYGSAPGVHTYAVPNTYPVTLTVYTAAGCEASYTQNITIGGPAVSTTISPSACNGPVAFAATVLGGNVIDWQWDFGDGFTSGQQNTEHTYDTPNTYTWTLTATDAAGCQTTATGNVTVVAPPASFALLYASPSCGPTTLSVPGAVIYTSYQWFNNGTAIPGATGSTYTATLSGNYSVEVVDVDGCIINSLPAMITIYPQPVITFTFPPLLCSDDDIIIQSNTYGLYTWDWKVDGIPYFAGPTLTIPGGTLGAGPHTVELTVSTTTGPTPPCSDYQSVVIMVEQSPTVFVTSSDPGGVCSGTPVTLTANSATAVMWDWSNGDMTSTTIVNAAGNYSVTVTDAVGCTASASAYANIFPLPDLSMLPIGCDSSCIYPTPEIIHGPPGMLSYQWYIDNTPAGTLQDLELNTSNLPTFGVPYQIKLVATSIYGCVDSSEFQYTPLECEVECFTIEDTIWCNDDGTYTMEIQVTNLGAATSTYLWLHDVNMPFTLTPSFVVPLTLATGATSAPISINVSYPIGSPLPAELCFLASLYNADTCCHDTTMYCIPLPPCGPCDNLVVTADTSAGCCATVNLTNGYNGSFFSGIEVAPLSPGVSIASLMVGPSYTGTWSAYGTASAMYVQPTGGFVPMGSIPGLFDVCLNVTVVAPPVQLVAVNWLYTDADGNQVVACSDTLEFTCPTPNVNPCGEISGDITCLGDGTYAYNYTFTNNNPNDVYMLVFTSVTPFVNITPNPVILPSAVAWGGSYTGTVIIDPLGLPAGTNICFDLTLADYDGWCCHEMDSICIPIPECDTCQCNKWENFIANVDQPGALPDYSLIASCGAVYNSIPAGTVIDFISGGYSCLALDGTSCDADHSWTLTGPGTAIDGSGYPSFSLLNPGLYTLDVVGYCQGNSCDTCTMYFEVVTADCTCGEWGLFTVSTPFKTWINRPCGSKFTVNAFDAISLNGVYNCSGACDAVYQWTIRQNGVPYASGFGMPVNFTPTAAGNYQVQMTAICGGVKCDKCTMTFRVKDADPPLRITEEDEQILRIQPNPASSEVTVRIDSPEEESGHLQVLNELGVPLRLEEMKLEKGSNTLLLDIADYPAGIYYIQYVGNGRVLNGQLIIVH